jgi:hypothetical protein
MGVAYQKQAEQLADSYRAAHRDDDEEFRY